MCNCQDAEGFDESLAKAKILTDETGETHVAYVHHAIGKSFVRKESDLNDELGICCYFLPDGTEVEYKTKKDLKEVAKAEPEIKKKNK